MKPYSRAVQRVMTTTTGVLCREPNVIIGKGSIYEIIVSLKKQNRTSVMVATTHGTIKRGTLHDFFQELEHASIKVTLFENVMADPTVECVEDMAESYVYNGCQAMIAIGGGSVIDCAKAALAKVVKPHKEVRGLRGALNVRRRIPDLYAVPTTAGTGTEATAASVVTDTIKGSHYKYAIYDPVLIPHFAILDPNLSLSLPPAMTGTTGMDALTHAVEAYTNRFASKKVKQTALAAVKIIFENLPEAYENGENIEAREEMLLGSYYAGVAFTNNFVGYVHAVAHAIGALYNIPHGFAVAVILPWVMEQYGKACHKELAELAKAAGVVSSQEDLDDAQCAMRFIAAIREMNTTLGIPETFVELKSEDFNEIIKRAIKEANPTYPVPVIWKKKDFIKLLDKLQG